jgi:hypothetical protein
MHKSFDLHFVNPQNFCFGSKTLRRTGFYKFVNILWYIAFQYLIMVLWVVTTQYIIAFGVNVYSLIVSGGYNIIHQMRYINLPAFIDLPPNKLASYEVSPFRPIQIITAIVNGFTINVFQSGYLI